MEAAKKSYFFYALTPPLPLDLSGKILSAFFSQELKKLLISPSEQDG